jgi:calcium/calmodulin-dependent protein kinase I
LVEAIGLCQSAGIAHRDIKLSNITFPAERRARNREIVVNRNSLVHNKDLVIKLADFGLAGLIGKDGKLRGRCGTPGFVAPDIFKAGTHEAYSSNVDIFSVSGF